MCFFFFFFFFTVTYHGRRDADYTVIIGSRATGTASCLVLLLCYLAGFHTATGQGGQLPFSSWRHSPHTSPQGVAEPTDSGLTTKGDMPSKKKAKKFGFFFFCFFFFFFFFVFCSGSPLGFPILKIFC